MVEVKNLQNAENDKAVKTVENAGNYITDTIVKNVENAHDAKNVDIASNKAVEITRNVAIVENNFPHLTNLSKMVSPLNMGKM